MKRIKTAYVGFGRRPWHGYLENLGRLADLYEVVGVFDPCREAAERAAGLLGGVPVFGSLDELLDRRPMEAVLYSAPVECRPALSLIFSRARLHHLCEAPPAPTLRQARQMAEEARRNRAVLYVNEPWPRRAHLAFARRVAASGMLGGVGRIVHAHGRPGVHSHAVWLMFAGRRPEAVNAVEHAMPLARYLDDTGHWRERETYRAHFLHFPGGLLVSDSAGDAGHARGRGYRPGYLEVAGSLGAFVEQPSGPWRSRQEVRLVPEDNVARGGYARVHPVVTIWRDGEGREHAGEYSGWSTLWQRIEVRLPDGPVVMTNPYAERGIHDVYGCAVAEAFVEFFAAVRGRVRPGFTAEMAADALELDAALALSAARGGARVALPLDEADLPPEAEPSAAEREAAGGGAVDAEAVVRAWLPRAAALPDEPQPTTRPTG